MARRRRRVLGAATLAIGSAAGSALIFKRKRERNASRADLYFEDGSMLSLVAGCARGRPAPAARRRGARSRRPVTRAELARRVAERALLHGDFVLRSGKRSPVYLDKYRFETDPALLGPIGAALAELVAASDPAPDRLAGPELGAVPLAAAASLASASRS